MLYTNTNRPKLLKFDDEILFKIKDNQYKYYVKESYLLYVNGYNDMVFLELDIHKSEFCSKHYGYESLFTMWPECKSHDYEALTRVVNALFDEIKKKYSPLPNELFILE
jgi:hypothetical protein